MGSNHISEGINKEELEDFMGITKAIRPIIIMTAQEIFLSYRLKLLTEPIDYIVPAIWGAKKNGKLDSTQKEIAQKVVNVVEELFEILDLKNLNRAQELAIGFLIRSLFIAKITYLINGVKNMVIQKLHLESQDTNILSHLEWSGSA